MGACSAVVVALVVVVAAVVVVAVVVVVVVVVVCDVVVVAVGADAVVCELSGADEELLQLQSKSRQAAAVSIYLIILSPLFCFYLFYHAQADMSNQKASAA